jgi:hypothetical protein
MGMAFGEEDNKQQSGLKNGFCGDDKVKKRILQWMLLF